MGTKKDKTAEGSIIFEAEQEFIYTADGERLSVSDFRKMIHEIEKGPFQTQEEFDKDIDLWLRENIIEKI